MTRHHFFWGTGRHRPTRDHEVHPYPHDLPVGPHAHRGGWAMYQHSVRSPQLTG